MSKNRKIDSLYQNFAFATSTGKKENRTKFASRSGYQKYFRPELKKLLKSLIGLDIVSVTMSLKKLKQNIYMLLLKKMYWLHLE